MALSLRARSWDWILRSKFLRAKTRFSEFLMWCVCSLLINRSIPLDCIFRCIKVRACSRLPFRTFTLIPLHCWSWCRWSERNPWLPDSMGWVERPTDLNATVTEFISGAQLFPLLRGRGLQVCIVVIRENRLSSVTRRTTIGLFLSDDWLKNSNNWIMK